MSEDDSRCYEIGPVVANRLRFGAKLGIRPGTSRWPRPEDPADAATAPEPLERAAAALVALLAGLTQHGNIYDDTGTQQARSRLAAHLVADWGLASAFVARALNRTGHDAILRTAGKVSDALAQLRRDAPDLKRREMPGRVAELLSEALAHSGQLLPEQRSAIDQIRASLDRSARSPGRRLVDRAATVPGRVRGSLTQLGRRLQSTVTPAGGPAAEATRAARAPRATGIADAAEPPVPVFWLLGKTGAGKTSLIRAFTGATEAEIGNGYVPCTRSSVVYDFPPDDPAMRFLDTRGLGEVGYDPADDLAACESATHLLLVLARLDDPVQGAVAEALARIRRGRRMPALVLHTAADCGSSDERARARAATQSRFDAAWGQPLPWLEVSLARPETADLDGL
ncbi:MAG TPA: GTPase domain-containing protein, partial [Burkholderiaceae bacterium]|nr:GTPase domain-containing protein [Burkholderiaceae bacterium]